MQSGWSWVVRWTMDGHNVQLDVLRRYVRAPYRREGNERTELIWRRVHMTNVEYLNM